MVKRRFMNLSVLLVVFLLLSVLALGGCETADPPVDDDDENGAPAPDPGPAPSLKTITVTLQGPPDTTDPHNHRQRVAQIVVRNWTNALTQTMPDGSHIMDLAVSIDKLDDVTYEVKLRQDAFQGLVLFRARRADLCEQLTKTKSRIHRVCLPESVGYRLSEEGGSAVWCACCADVLCLSERPNYEAGWCSQPKYPTCFLWVRELRAGYFSRFAGS